MIDKLIAELKNCDSIVITEKQIETIKKELTFKIAKNEKLRITASGNFNSNMEIIYKVELVEDMEQLEGKFVCYC